MSDTKTIWLKTKVEGKAGLIDATGQERLPARYDFVSPVGEDRLFVRESKGGWVLDSTGAPLFEVDAFVMRPYREGRAAFLRSGSWGFLDGEGNVVVEPLYDDVAIGHQDGVVRVADRKGRKFLVDREGEELLPDAKEAQSPRNGIVAFQAKNKKWGLYSARRREVVLEPAHAMIFGHPASDHWILKKSAKKWGAADAEGAVAIEPKLPWLGTICEDRGATRNAAGSVGFVDSTGAVVIEHQFESRTTQDDMSRFADGRCAVQQGGKLGFIDRAGEMVVEPRWVNAFFFGEGRGTVVDEAGWTYVDEAGAPITEHRFQRAETFAGGIGVVSTAEGKGAVRRDGEMVVPPVCRSVFTSDGVLRVADSSSRMAYYRADGSCIWRHAEFEHELSPALS